MLEQYGKDLARLKLNINEIAGLQYPPQIVLEVVELARTQQRLFQSELARVQPSLTAMQLAASETVRRIAPALEAFQRQAQEIDQVTRLFGDYLVDTGRSPSVELGPCGIGSELSAGLTGLRSQTISNLSLVGLDGVCTRPFSTECSPLFCITCLVKTR
jgi:hypothetical protein